MESRFGQTVASMKVSGVMIKPTGMEGLFCLKEMYIRANVTMIKLMDKERYITLTEQLTKAPGSTTNSKVWGKNNGLMAVLTKVSTLEE